MGRRSRPGRRCSRQRSEAPMGNEFRVLRAANLALVLCLVLTACHYESCKQPLEDFPHGPDWGPVYHVRPLLSKGGPVRNDVVWGDNGTLGAYYLATQPGVVRGAADPDAF